MLRTSKVVLNDLLFLLLTAILLGGCLPEGGLPGNGEGYDGRSRDVIRVAYLIAPGTVCIAEDGASYVVGYQGYLEYFNDGSINHVSACTEERTPVTEEQLGPLGEMVVDYGSHVYEFREEPPQSSGSSPFFAANCALVEPMADLGDGFLVLRTGTEYSVVSYLLNGNELDLSNPIPIEARKPNHLIHLINSVTGSHTIIDVSTVGQQGVQSFPGLLRTESDSFALSCTINPILLEKWKAQTNDSTEQSASTGE